MNRMLVLLIAASMTAEVGAYCASREEKAARYAEKPVFELTSCVSAQEYLSSNEKYLKAAAKDERFAAYLTRAGIQDSSKAVAVKPRNAAAVAFMFGADKAVWMYDGQCEEVPLNSNVMLKTRQSCSDTGYQFITFFDDVGILEIYSL